METPAPRKEPLFSQDYFLCTFSLTMLMASSAMGTMAILAFLAPWGLIALKRLSNALHIIVKNWVLLLIPGVACLSGLWSNDHIWSFKAGLELGVTIIAGILAAEMVSSTVFIRSLISSLIIISMLCVLAGIRDGLTGLGGSGALQGIYDSKNAFSAVMALLMLVSISVWADKTQPMIYRLAGVGGVFMTPVLLYLGQSVGAIIAVIITIFIYMFIRFLSRLGKSIRALVFGTAVVLVLAIGSAFAMAETNPLDILNLLGKDSTLTGRTYLWAHAASVISEQPILGVGYRAFWRIGNHHAEQLWFDSHVPIGSGFNFHNEYLEIMVELGAFGLILMLLFFGAIAKRVADASMEKMSPAQGFACMLFIMYMLRTPVEVGIFDQFGVQIVLFCVIWIYLRPLKPEKVRTSLLKPPPKNISAASARYRHFSTSGPSKRI